MPNTIITASVLKGVNTSEAAGNLTFNKFVIDLADPKFVGVTYAVSDKVQIGLVPAGEILVPHLCLLRLPILDSNGSPTGTGTIGSAAVPAGILGSFNFGTAVNESGEDWVLATSEVGADNADTPIYLTVTALVATRAPTGKIIFYQVSRPWDSSVDGASTS